MGGDRGAGRALLACEQRFASRTLTVRFDLDDEYLDGLLEERMDAKRLVVEEAGRVRVEETKVHNVS